MISQINRFLLLLCCITSLFSCTKYESKKDSFNKQNIDTQITFLNAWLIDLNLNEQWIKFWRNELFQLNKKRVATQLDSTKWKYPSSKNPIWINFNNSQISEGLDEEVLFVSYQNLKKSQFEFIDLNIKKIDSKELKIDQLKSTKEAIDFFEKERYTIQKKVEKKVDSLELIVLNKHPKSDYIKNMKIDLRIVQYIIENYGKKNLNLNEATIKQKELIQNLKAHQSLPLINLERFEQQKYATFYQALDDFLLTSFEFLGKYKQKLNTQSDVQTLVSYQKILINLYESFY